MVHKHKRKAGMARARAEQSWGLVLCGPGSSIQKSKYHLLCKRVSDPVVTGKSGTQGSNLGVVFFFSGFFRWLMWR